jgi:3-oxoacyl-[acyl-carrier protein] reductase
MTVTWAKELGLWGIRCNAIAPGFIDTASTRQVLKESALKHIEKSTPLRRLGQPQEVAQAVQFIIENEYMNGSILEVTGGLRL